MYEKSMYQELYKEAEKNIKDLELQLKLKADLLAEVELEKDWLEREVIEKNGWIAAYQFMLKLHSDSGIRK